MVRSCGAAGVLLLTVGGLDVGPSRLSADRCPLRRGGDRTLLASFTAALGAAVAVAAGLPRESESESGSPFV